MIKYSILGAIFILVATAVVATFQSVEEVTILPTSAQSSSSADFEQRLGALERAVADEREQRIQLETELARWREMDLSSEGLEETVSGENRFGVILGEDGLPENLQQIREQVEERRTEARGNTEERQLASLVEAGFDQFQAEEIVRTTEEMQMDLLNARFEASQTGEDFNAGEMQAQAIADLRTSLGDTDYERYLEATNQSTNVGVSNVLASSPAEIAGMQSGDEILSYNGERVFSTNDLNRLTSSSVTSGNVVVEVMRDGQSVSLSMPTGPIGITSGRGFNRGR